MNGANRGYTRIFSVENVNTSPVARKVCNNWRETLGQILNPGRSVMKSIVFTAVASASEYRHELDGNSFSKLRSTQTSCRNGTGQRTQKKRPEGNA